MDSSSYSVIRTEKKYEISPIVSGILKKRLAKIMTPDQHSGTDGYLVRSLYFDSIHDHDLFDKLDGLESRKKIRLRLYTPDQQWIKLELKQKQGSVQVKKTLEIPNEMANRLLHGDFKSLLTLPGDFPKILYQMMSCGVYRPKCVIEYRRTAFMVPANDTRITIDSDIRATKNCDCFFEHNAVLAPLLNQPVLEVKYNGFLLEHCRQAVNMADIPEMSFSKYEMARQLVC